jgi:hypothetical protein
MHYRDDQAVIEARRDDLRQELAELTKKDVELRVTEQERASIERELASLEAQLSLQKASRASLLDDIRIASPCDVSWDEMIGEGRVRFCGACQKNVYNLSAMTRDEAETLLAAREGSICVRLYQRADGTMITTDCPEGGRRWRRQRAAVAVAGAGAMAVSAAVAAWAMRKPVVPSIPTPIAVAPPSQTSAPTATIAATIEPPPTEFTATPTAAPSTEPSTPPPAVSPKVRRPPNRCF